MSDLVSRLTNSNPTESSQELACRCGEAAIEICHSQALNAILLKALEALCDATRNKDDIKAMSIRCGIAAEAIAHAKEGKK
jgi:hypothetical protein